MASAKMDSKTAYVPLLALGTYEEEVEENDVDFEKGFGLEDVDEEKARPAPSRVGALSVVIGLFGA